MLLVILVTSPDGDGVREEKPRPSDCPSVLKSLKRYLADDKDGRGKKHHRLSSLAKPSSIRPNSSSSPSSASAVSQSWERENTHS